MGKRTRDATRILDELTGKDTELRKIWDVPTRIFHWALVLAVGAGWILGKYGPFIKTYHFYLGYAVIALLVFRLLWGFIGAKPSRFSNFIYGPRAILGYMAHMFQRRPSHFQSGHSGQNLLPLYLMIQQEKLLAGKEGAETLFG